MVSQRDVSSAFAAVCFSLRGQPSSGLWRFAGDHESLSVHADARSDGRSPKVQRKPRLPFSPVSEQMPRGNPAKIPGSFDPKSRPDHAARGSVSGSPELPHVSRALDRRCSFADHARTAPGGSSPRCARGFQFHHRLPTVRRASNAFVDITPPFCAVHSPPNVGRPIYPLVDDGDGWSGAYRSTVRHPFQRLDAFPLVGTA